MWLMDTLNDLMDIYGNKWTYKLVNGHIIQ